MQAVCGRHIRAAAAIACTKKLWEARIWTFARNGGSAGRRWRLPAGGTHTLTVIFYGECINTATMTLQEEQWNYFSVDLSKFAGDKKVEQIKIWYNSGCAEAFNKFIYVDGIGFSGENGNAGTQTDDDTAPQAGCGATAKGAVPLAAACMAVAAAAVIVCKRKKGEQK